MNQLLDSDLRDESRSNDREISLGIPTILGIFFALALVCAGFFGFGYSLGRKSGQNAATSSVAASSSPSVFAKPAAGSPNRLPAFLQTPAQPAAPEAELVPVAPQAKNGLTPADGMIAGDKPAADKPSIEKPAVISTPKPVAPAFMVQIAAVSSQEVADIEITALKKYGYDVGIHHEPQDQLLHIQIGPFPTRKDAEVMRADVEKHGFNAIIK